jgi:hypothetical protein
MKYIQKIWKRWLVIGKIIGNIQAQVLFTFLYFVLFWIVGIITLNSGDPLRLKKSKIRTNFVPWKYDGKTIDDARKPY